MTLTHAPSPTFECLVAAVVAGIAVPLLRWFSLRRGLLDIPNDRSSHAVPTPRLGGVGIIAGIGVAVAFSPAVLGDGAVRAILVSCVILAVGGLVDDIRTVSVAVKFLFQIAGSLLVISGGVLLLDLSVISDAKFALPVALAVLGTLFWLVGFTNAFNFMDGINGIAAMQAIVALGAMSFLAARQGAGELAAIAIITLAAVVGFLPWNFPRAVIFMGDGGSAALGFMIASIAVLLARRGLPLEAAILPVCPFLWDTSVTLVRRASRGERIFTAHRSHLYQRLTAIGWSHAAVTSLWTLLALVSSGVALGYERQPVRGRILLLMGVVLVHVLVTVGTVLGERRLMAPASDSRRSIS